MIATALVAAQYLGTVDFSDRTDLRYRVTEQNPITPGAPLLLSSGIDLSSQIAARLLVTDRRWEFTLAYGAILTAPGVIQLTPEVGNAPPALLVIQSASASVSWHSRRLRLTSTGGVTYGEFDSAFLYQAQAEAGQPVVLQAAPQPQAIEYLSWYAGESAALRIDRRSNVGLSVGYQESGQLNASETPAVPRAYGPHANAAFDFMLDRDDHLVTSGMAMLTTFSSAPCAPLAGMTAPPVGITCAPQSEVASVQEELRHQFSRADRGTVGVGVGESDVRHMSPGASPNASGYLLASASVSHTFGPQDQGAFLASAQLLPVTDALTGDVSDELQGALSLTDRLSRIVGLRVSLTGAQSILPENYPFPITLGAGEVQATFKLNRWVDVAVGDQALWENEKNLGSVVSVFCYVGMTVRAETLHF